MPHEGASTSLSLGASILICNGLSKEEVFIKSALTVLKFRHWVLIQLRVNNRGANIFYTSEHYYSALFCISLLKCRFIFL